MILAMKSTRQDLKSIGVNGKDTGKVIFLGAVVSALYIMITGIFVLSTGGGFAGFSSSLAYGFIAYTIVGFSEEAVFRGYIQTRLVAYGGMLKGWIGTSLLSCVLSRFTFSFLECCWRLWRGLY